MIDFSSPYAQEAGLARDVSSQVLFLDKGRIEAEGPPDVMFSNCESERFRRFTQAQH